MDCIQLQAYNTTVKIAGQSIVIKRHDRNLFKGYSKKRATEKACSMYTSFSELGFGGEVAEMCGIEKELVDIETGEIVSNPYLKGSGVESKVNEKQKRERFEKSNARAKSKIHDLISCNCDKEGRTDYFGNKQIIKFLTLTFKEDIIDQKKANKEFTEFMKRLSYFHFGVRKNVINYVAIPEVQGKKGWVRENTPVWHFHIVLFNCPYTDNKKKNGYKLEQIWGNGYCYVNALKRKNGKTIDPAYIAGYITKYLTKELEYVEDSREMRLQKNEKVKDIYDYDRHQELGLKNAKRYFASKGLKKPTIAYMDLDRAQASTLMTFLKSKMLKNKREYKKTNKYEYENAMGQKVLSFMFVNSFSLVLDGIEKVKSLVMGLCKTSFRKRKENNNLKTPWHNVSEGSRNYDKALDLYYTMRFDSQNEGTVVSYA